MTCAYYELCKWTEKSINSLRVFYITGQVHVICKLDECTVVQEFS